MKEEMLSDCDRCEEQVSLETEVKSYVNYKNAFLCMRCAKIRRFDDDNPIMYPIYKD